MLTECAKSISIHSKALLCNLLWPLAHIIASTTKVTTNKAEKATKIKTLHLNNNKVEAKTGETKLVALATSTAAKCASPNWPFWFLPLPFHFRWPRQANNHASFTWTPVSSAVNFAGGVTCQLGKRPLGGPEVHANSKITRLTRNRGKMSKAQQGATTGGVPCMLTSPKWRQTACKTTKPVKPAHHKPW